MYIWAQLSTYLRHGNHSVDFLMLMIDSYICRQMNRCIYLSAQKSLSIFCMTFICMYKYVWFDIPHTPRDVSIYIHICMHIYLSYFYRHMNWIIHLFNQYMIELLTTRLLNDRYLPMPRVAEVSPSTYLLLPHLLHKRWVAELPQGVHSNISRLSHNVQ